MSLRGARAWVDYLDKVELPVLSKTIKSISEISESDDVKIEELVRVILQDADLTSKVLKLANSVCYNPMRIPTTTMSRAIVQVGFESVKAIAISSVLVDQLSRKNNQQQLFNCLVRSFHAAVQAKYLAADMSLEEQEAIFIAALLFDVGEAAFWSCSSNKTQKLEEMKSIEGHCYIDDQQVVLGTSFKSISRGLSACWGLGSLHEESLNQASSRAARIVCAATELARRHSQGWDKETLNHLIPSIAALSDRSATQIRKDLPKNAEQAAKLAEKFGIKGARQHLKAKKHKPQMRPNPQSQFDALLKISELQNSQSSHFDGLVMMILDSMHFSIGLERVVLFVAKNDAGVSGTIGRHFHVYRASGAALNAWQGRDELHLSQSHPFSKVLDEKNCGLINISVGERQLPTNHLLAAPFDVTISSIVGALRRGRKLIGFIYADRLNEHEISNEQLCSFRLFVQQMQFCFDRKVER